MESKKIYTKLALINKEVSAVGKNGKNTFQKYNFRAIDDVMQELHGLFAKHGVIILQNFKEVINNEMNINGSKVVTLFKGVYNFTFVAEDGSSVTTSYVGEGHDTSDKACNKAISAALKYCLTQMFLIPTEEKKDSEHDAPINIDLYAKIEKEVNKAKSVMEITAIWKKHESSVSSDESLKRKVIDLMSKTKEKLQNEKK